MFGVHHFCHMKVQDDPLIKVIPKLPLVKVRSVLPSQPGDSGGAGEGERPDPVRRISRAGQDKFDLMDGERYESG